MTDADNTNDLALLTNTQAQTESLLYSLDQACVLNKKELSPNF